MRTENYERKEEVSVWVEVVLRSASQLLPCVCTISADVDCGQAGSVCSAGLSRRGYGPISGGTQARNTAVHGYVRS
jgi:hypothetical protein